MTVKIERLPLATDHIRIDPRSGHPVLGLGVHLPHGHLGKKGDTEVVLSHFLLFINIGI